MKYDLVSANDQFEVPRHVNSRSGEPEIVPMEIYIFEFSIRLSFLSIC